MGLQEKIKRAAKKVIKRERELGVAMEKYQELIDEAYRRGIEVPRTELTNPFMAHRKR